jgi:hypothetical protein
MSRRPTGGPLKPDPLRMLLTFRISSIAATVAGSPMLQASDQLLLVSSPLTGIPSEEFEATVPPVAGPPPGRRCMRAAHVQAVGVARGSA